MEGRASYMRECRDAMGVVVVKGVSDLSGRPLKLLVNCE